MKRACCYNLPCFNALYKDYQEELDIDFQDLFVHFSKENDVYMRKSIASSIHEALMLCKQEEDSFKLRECFRDLLEDENHEVVEALCQNLNHSI